MTLLLELYRIDVLCAREISSGEFGFINIGFKEALAYSRMFYEARPARLHDKLDFVDRTNNVLRLTLKCLAHDSRHSKSFNVRIGWCMCHKNKFSFCTPFDHTVRKQNRQHFWTCSRLKPIYYRTSSDASFWPILKAQQVWVSKNGC